LCIDLASLYACTLASVNPSILSYVDYTVLDIFVAYAVAPAIILAPTAAATVAPSTLSYFFLLYDNFLSNNYAFPNFDAADNFTLDCINSSVKLFLFICRNASDYFINLTILLAVLYYAI
jgi:hypothetical protein